MSSHFKRYRNWSTISLGDRRVSATALQEWLYHITYFGKYVNPRFPETLSGKTKNYQQMRKNMKGKGSFYTKQ